MSEVYVQFPKTGLGNMLLVWAQAKVFAKINGIPLFTSSWFGMRPGALLRREKQSRLYLGYFKETGFVKRLLLKVQALRNNNIINPKVEKLSDQKKPGTLLYIFNKVPAYPEMFSELEPYREFLQSEIFQLLKPKLKEQLSRFEAPVIGVHLRRGDFKRGSTITPLSFFVNSVRALRKHAGEELAVTVFTDADEEEIRELLLLPKVKLAESKADILDILLLSRSRFLVLSATSSFSYWAAFLSDAVTIRPPGDWMPRIRKRNDGSYREIDASGEYAQIREALADNG